MDKIKIIENLIVSSKVNMGTTEYFSDLFKIHHELYNFLYFKMYQENCCLNPPEEENEKEKQKNN